MGWITPVAAILLAGLLGGLFLWWFRGHRLRVRQYYARQRSEDLRHALRSQRLALGETVVDGLPDPLLILNKKRDVTLANRAARDLFGTGVVGRNVAFSLRQPQVLAIVDRALQQARPEATEVSLLDPVSRDFHVRVAPLLPRTETGEIETDFESLSDEQPALAVSLHEISEIRRTESMRADFVANVSHELKTPLANLIGFVETLRGPARDDAEARDRFLQIMEDEAARMSRLINDLLSLSRIELDEHVRPQDAVDLHELLQGALRLMQLRAEQSHVTLVLDLPDDLPSVRGDADQLMQVFQNLLDNAIKYSDEGDTVTVAASVTNRLPESALPGVLIEVRDEGEGIPPEHLPRLTERFYRVDSGRSRKLGGTGLGLAIVKHITRRHRGWLDIQSTPGQGTTVIVGVPQFGIGPNDKA